MKTTRTVLITALIALFAILIPVKTFAQDAKLEKAEAKFCKSIDGFLGSLNTLLSLDDYCTYKEFRKAYNKAVKKWNKMVKSGDKLEDVIIKESAKAYDEFTQAVDLVNGEEWTSKSASKVDKHMDNMSDIVSALQAMHCE